MQRLIVVWSYYYPNDCFYFKIHFLNSFLGKKSLLLVKVL
jgi:hypothetical protein